MSRVCRYEPDLNPSYQDFAEHYGVAILPARVRKPRDRPYTDKAAALDVLRAHAERLQHDGFIEFGLMFQQSGKTEEVMVKGSKDLRIWTNNPTVAIETLASLGIPRVDKLQFIDEYPRVTERLVGDAPSEETISAIVGAFQSLPQK